MKQCREAAAQELPPVAKNQQRVEAGRDLWRSSRSIITSRSNRATETQLTRTMSSWLLNIPRDGDSTTSLLACAQVLGHPHSEKVFPDVQKEPLVFRFVPADSSSATGHH